MYQIVYTDHVHGDLILYDPRDPALIVREPACRLRVGEAGELSFIVDPDHPHAAQIEHMGRVTLLSDGAAIYRGRVRRASRDFYSSVEVETEGLLACLNDSVTPPYSFPADWETREDAEYLAASQGGNVVEFFLRWLLSQHNAQVGEAQRIALGTVTVSDPNNYLYRASESRLTTAESVKKKLTEGLGGYLLVDYSQPTPVLNYYADLPLTNTQSVEFGENLLDLVTEMDAADMYTAILPEGKDGLTIADLPDGELTPGYIKDGDIIYSTAAEAALGGQRITRVEKWADVTTAQHLQTKARVKLSTEGVKLSRTIRAKAADLGATSNDVAQFRVGRYVQLTSAPHGYDLAYPLMELDVDIFDPSRTEITLGDTVLTSAGMAQSGQHRTEEALERQQIELNQQKAATTEQAQTTQAQITAAIQTAESMIFSALESYVQTSNYEEFRSSVESQLVILADAITLKFTETLERITDVDGDLQKTVETLAKHFEFGADGLSIRGGAGSMTLRLDNDLIIFERNGQQFGYWDGVDFHTGNIVVDVNERAQFGNFAFVPRSDGSLSFLKVGG